jgi:Flp pilus assembly protein TadD
LSDQVTERAKAVETLRKRAEAASAERGRQDEAVDLWRRYLDVVDGTGMGEALLELGRALVKARREGEAVDVLRRCTEALPESFEAHALLGEILKQTGRLAAAVEALERAAELNPDDVQALVSLVVCLEALGRRSDAEAALAALRQRGAGNPAVAALMQELLQRRG